MKYRACEFPGCTNKHRAKGYCQPHYLQLWHGRTLTPLVTKVRYSDPSPGTKVCTKCLRVLDRQQDFYTRSESDRLMSSCKSCVSKANRVNELKRKARKKAGSNG